MIKSVDSNRVSFSKRNYIDCVRGIAVFLMVWGHTIQCGNGQIFIEERAYYSDMTFRSIYSFHMPLFAILSGFLLFSSLESRSCQEVMKKRIVSLGLPIVTWGSIDFVISLINNEIQVGLFSIVRLMFFSLVGGAWFLWAILMCTAAVVVNRRFFHDSLLFHVLIMVTGLFFTDRFNLGYFKFLYPFFVAGYCWNHLYKIIYPVINDMKKSIAVFVSIFVSWEMMVYAFGPDKFIYTTGYCLTTNTELFRQLFIDAYRVAIGYLGSGVVLLLVWMIFQFSGISNMLFLSKLGKFSLGVYLFDIYISNYCLKPIFANSQPSSIRAFFVSIALSFICVVITYSISQNSVLNLILLGGRKKSQISKPYI